VKDELLLEMWEAWEHHSQKPVLVLRRKSAAGAVEIHLDEARYLVEALVNAAAELAAATVIPPQFTD
jgi:hypothetical protein